MKGGLAARQAGKEEKTRTVCTVRCLQGLFQVPDWFLVLIFQHHPPGSTAECVWGRAGSDLWGSSVAFPGNASRRCVPSLATCLCSWVTRPLLWVTRGSPGVLEKAASWDCWSEFPGALRPASLPWWAHSEDIRVSAQTYITSCSHNLRQMSRNIAMFLECDLGIFQLQDKFFRGEYISPVIIHYFFKV